MNDTVHFVKIKRETTKGRNEAKKIKIKKVKSGYQREHELLVPRYNKKAQTGDFGCNLKQPNYNLKSQVVGCIKI
jgi:hypothetical protein